MTSLVPAIRAVIRERIPGGLAGSVVSVSHEVDEALLQVGSESPEKAGRDIGVRGHAVP